MPKKSEIKFQTPQQQKKQEQQVEEVLLMLEEMKAQDIITLDVQHLTPLTDTMIIATGRSNRHVKSTAERIVEQMKALKMPCLGVEGLKDGEWVLIDLNGTIVHVMQQKTRDYYQLEKLWGLSTSTMLF